MKERKEISEEFIQNLVSKPIYISKVKNLFDLKVKIQKIYNNISQKNIVVNDIRLWKINSNLSNIEVFLNQNISELNNSKKLFNLTELNYLECNFEFYV